MTSGQTVYFRRVFDVPADYKPGGRTRIRINVDDYSDAMYLNGREIAARDFASAVRLGRNVFALKARNSHGSAGVLFRLFVDRPDGGVDVIASDTAVKCAENAPDGWFAADFDDSGWKPSYEVGDVTVPPWARTDAFVRSFMTDSEWAGYQSLRESSAPELPDGELANEPEPDAKIVYKGWLPKISLNGKILEPDFSLPIALGRSQYQDAAVVKLNSFGFLITRVTTADINFWKGEGQYDFSDLDRQARRLLKLAPDARMEIFLEFRKMAEWCRLHPSEIVGYAAGAPDQKAWDDLTQRVIRPSAASEAFREEIARVVAAFGVFVRSRSWGKRAVAIRLGYGIYTEWHTYGMYEGPDSGPAMTKAFRVFLRRKYGSDAALAEAWNTPGATISSAMPPTMEERGPDVAILDPSRYRKALDFFECNSEVTADTLLFLARKTKEALPGRLVGAYYGYVFASHPPEGVNLLVDKVLASPYIDFLSNPATYTPTTRRAGGSYTLRAIPSSFHRYGKLCVCEDDMRFHHARRYEVSNAYATETPEESKATAKRNYLNRLFDGIGYQALDLSPGWRPAAFDDPSVLEGLYEAKRETAAAGDPGLDSGNELAVVIDYRGRLRLGNKPHKHADVRVRYCDAPEHLYRTGMTFDMMTLDDYLASKQRYAHVLFLNPGESDPVLMAEAKKRAGEGMLVCDGLFKSAAQYRELLEKAGVHAWIKPGSYIRRHGKLLMFHTGKAGRHELSLPAGFAGAQSLSTGVRHDGGSFVVEVQGPHTELFRLVENRKGDTK